MNSSDDKPTNSVNSTSTSPIDQRCSASTTPNLMHSKSNPFHQRKPTSIDVPDVDDPLTFIELMYQQMFTEDGQLKAGNDPSTFANCVKQIVTQSRRNSFARRDSTMLNNPLHFPKHSSMSFHHPTSSKRTSRCASRCPSPRFMHQPLSEEEDSNTMTTHRTHTADRSRRNSKRLSFDHNEHHQQQLHAFLNSYYQHQKHVSTRPNFPRSVDDTDNEDLDTFSDLNSYRKPVRHSPPASIDEDSKLMSSSGYHSIKTPPKKFENEQQCCPNCAQTSQNINLPSTTSLSTINVFQSIKETFVKYVNFALISKNILVLPLLLFFLRQRSTISISN